MNVSYSQIITNTEKRTLLLSVTPELVTVDRVQSYAEREGLLQKQEFHITLIGNALGRLLSDAQYEEVRTYINTLELHFVSRGEYYLVTKSYGDEIRTSIIECIEFPAQTYVHAFLRDRGISIGDPFPHITLFTNSTDVEKQHTGIGIESKEIFQSLEHIRLI